MRNVRLSWGGRADDRGESPNHSPVTAIAVADVQRREGLDSHIQMVLSLSIARLPCSLPIAGDQRPRRSAIPCGRPDACWGGTHRALRRQLAHIAAAIGRAQDAALADHAHGFARSAMP